MILDIELNAEFNRLARALATRGALGGVNGGTLEYLELLETPPQ